MSAPQSVAEILNNHVTFELECIDRMYLNVYVPALQFEGGVVKFFRSHRGHPFASSALMDPMTKSFVAATERFAKQEQIPVVQFRKGQRKDDVMAEHLARFDQPEGVVMLGKAQEKTPVFRTEKRRNPETGKSYPWIVRSPFLGWLAAKHSMRVPPPSDRADGLAYPNGIDPEPTKRSGIRIIPYDAKAGVREFEHLGMAVEAAKLEVPIDAAFSFGDAARAHQRLAQGHVLGKIVLQID